VHIKSLHIIIIIIISTRDMPDWTSYLTIKSLDFPYTLNTAVSLFVRPIFSKHTARTNSKLQLWNAACRSSNAKEQGAAACRQTVAEAGYSVSVVGLWHVVVDATGN